MPNPNHPPQSAARDYIKQTTPWLPIFTIWGAEWMVVAVLEIIGTWKFPGWLEPALFAIAALASLFVLLRGKRAPGDRSGNGGSSSGGASLMWLLPPLVLAGAVFLLEWLHAIDPYYREMFRSLLMAFFYVQLGVFAGRPFVYLGLWLFALCAVIGTLYVGFSAEVLGLFGGASLLACGWLLRRIVRSPREQGT